MYVATSSQPKSSTADSVLLLAACHSFCSAQLNQGMHMLVFDRYGGYASKFICKHTKVELLESCVCVNAYRVVVDSSTSSRAPDCASRVYWVMLYDLDWILEIEDKHANVR